MPLPFNNIGRIIARGKVAGLYLPFRTSDLHGIYEVREVLGELQVVHIGNSCMKPASFTGMDLDGLFHYRPYCAMTPAEISGLGYSAPDWLAPQLEGIG